MDHDLKQPAQPGATDNPEQVLKSTAEEWRESAQGTDAESSAEEVASGADQAAEQPGYGREGS
jgi:hypothetical protein